jgi:hypothetical protein
MLPAHQPQANPQKVFFIAPARRQKPRRHFVYPYDFFWALLVGWDLPRLGRFMTVLHHVVNDLPPDNLCNADYWKTYWLPILAPKPESHPASRAFDVLAKAAALALKHGQHDAPDLVASMRLSALIAFVADYRVRLVVMFNDARIHGRLGTRPPPAHDVWAFFVHNGRAQTLGYVDEVGLLRRETQSTRREQWIVQLTHDRLKTLTRLMLWPPPLPLPPKASEEEEEEGEEEKEEERSECFADSWDS